MSNLEITPAELTCQGSATGHTAGQLLQARAVPLGGPRAMTVRRTLPQRQRSLIGAWCFIDHYGPDDVSATGGMAVPGHPHTGLQTVSWLFAGAIEHRDTSGARAVVRPGELNLMTAGSGIAHSEYSTPATTVLHGVQLWAALPDAHRFSAPGFEHFAPQVVDHDGLRALVFLGTLHGQSSPARTYSPLLGAELTVPAGRRVTVELDRAFEHGLLIDSGHPTVAGVAAGPGQLVYQDTGSHILSIDTADTGPARLLLLGGEPLGERIVMWWNFLGRSHDEIVDYRTQWQAERVAHTDASRFGRFPTEWQHTLPAPALPNLRLRPRD